MRRLDGSAFRLHAFRESLQGKRGVATDFISVRTNPFSVATAILGVLRKDAPLGTAGRRGGTRIVALRAGGIFVWRPVHFTKAGTRGVRTFFLAFGPPVCFFLQQQNTPLTMPASYYPETNDGRADWWQNKIDNAAVIAALNAALAPSILADAAVAVYLYRTLPNLYDGFNKQVTGYINAFLSHADGTPVPNAPPVPAWPALPAPGVLAGIETRRAKWAQVLKNAGAYDPATHGVTLHLEPAGAAFDANNYQAVIVDAQSLAPAQVSAKFRKARGSVTGVAFSGRRKSGGAFTDLGRFTVSPASLHIPIATPGQPEEWELQAQAFKRDTLIGTPSDIKPVLVRG